MTPDEFKAEMESVCSNVDREEAHEEADMLMIRLLIELGYESGCLVFLKSERWYA